MDLTFFCTDRLFCGSCYRLVHNEVRLLQNPHKNILDGDLIWKFLHLSMPERSELARRIGTSVEQVTIINYRNHHGACI